jgi:hypothetical protein
VGNYDWWPVATKYTLTLLTKKKQGKIVYKILFSQGLQEKKDMRYLCKNLITPAN